MIPVFGACLPPTEWLHQSSLLIDKVSQHHYTMHDSTGTSNDMANGYPDMADQI